MKDGVRVKTMVHPGDGFMKLLVVFVMFVLGLVIILIV